ncbi:MAG: glutamate racemase [Verrucomicrobiota bacterium]|nr:glutamate racemase [Verrucomicrobiota bacterium]
MNSLPIGVFDSGIGGLTVVNAIQEHLPNEDIVYVGDTARVPYGSRSPGTVIEYATQIAAHLEHIGVKEILIACNTASAVALEAVAARTTLPVSGVIIPGAEAAVELSGSAPIGVIATRATITSDAYRSAIQRFNPAAEVVSVATPLLVPLIEEDCMDESFTPDILRHYFEPTRLHACDTLILGCTHYPLLADQIARVFGKPVVDTPTATALTLAKSLDQRNTRNESDGAGSLSVLLTDDADRSLGIVSRRLGVRITETSRVDLSELAAPETRPPNSPSA